MTDTLSWDYRFFAERVKFLINEQRVVAITPIWYEQCTGIHPNTIIYHLFLFISIIGYDFQEKVKEKIDFVNIKEVICGKKKHAANNTKDNNSSKDSSNTSNNKKEEITIKPKNGENISYLCEDRENLLSRIFYGVDKATNNRGNMFKAERIKHNEVFLSFFLISLTSYLSYLFLLPFLYFLSLCLTFRFFPY